MHSSEGGVRVIYRVWFDLGGLKCEDSDARAATSSATRIVVEVNLTLAKVDQCFFGFGFFGSRGCLKNKQKNSTVRTVTRK